MRVLGSVLLLCGLLACEKDVAEPGTRNSDGLPPEITREVPAAILDSMRLMGMPIFTGNTPPNIEGSYEVSRFVLIEGNHAGDRPGKLFRDYEVTFSEQNNEQRSIAVSYVNGAETGADIGSFITGEGCRFSVFILFDPGYHSGTDSAKYVHVLSGTHTETGIQDFHYSNFMIDNYGNPRGVWINDGEGRVIHDRDRFSPRSGSPQLAWHERLPDCPCELTDDLDGREEMCGTWLVCNEASQEHHFGAAYEVRWRPGSPGGPGQQCTYDGNRRLITGGIAAGSPDVVSPMVCGFWENLVDWPGAVTVCAHVREDVVPWGDAAAREVCGGSSVRAVSCTQYLRNWPANQGDRCEENVVSGIEHLERMTRGMTCAEISSIMVGVATSTAAHRELKDYLAGVQTTPPGGLRDHLIAYRDSLECGIVNNATLCAILLRAINNLR